MTSGIGVGIIGSGFMGRTWAETVRRSAPETHVAAVAGGSRAGKLAADYGVPHLDVDALLAHDDVDLVVLATPPRTHVDLAVRAARAGRHVLIEKPMAQSIAECDTITAACGAADVTLAIVSQHRFRASPRAALAAITGGRIGTVRMIRVTGATAGYDADDAWKFDASEQTAFADWGAHACDLTRWFAGADPVLAFGTTASYQPSPPPDQSAMVIFRFANDVLADIWMTYEIPQPGLGSAMQLLITGSEGMIQLDSYGAVRLGRGDGWETIYEQPSFDPLDPLNPVRIEAYAAELLDVVGAIRDRRQPVVNAAEGRRTIEMLEAADRSIRSGRAVALPL